MSESALVDRIVRLEQRIQEAEDRLAIYNLIASYGPAVDSCTREQVYDIWAEGGTYELQGFFFTSDSLDGIIDNDLHQRYVKAGSAHVMSLPKITLNGDSAVAINYSRVFIHDGSQWVVDRTGANRWDLERMAEGWKVRRRVNLLANGTPEARALLAGEVPAKP